MGREALGTGFPFAVRRGREGTLVVGVCFPGAFPSDSGIVACRAATPLENRASVIRADTRRSGQHRCPRGR